MIQITRVQVGERTGHRIIADPKTPQAVEQLAVAHAARVGQHNRQHSQATLRPIVGEQAAEEEHFIIRMSKQKHHIRVLVSGLPYLHPAGELAFAQHEYFFDAEMFAVIVFRHQTDALFSIQRIILMDKLSALVTCYFTA
ncbi:hypothetical protein SDC9_153819 [bioreactor metagenome]|uniref:Uncharacterized protein n=1 Tax=bioreactor metagenome TaxID=1076179 RepID=A0A645F1N2_9ZZZZ